MNDAPGYTMDREKVWPLCIEVYELGGLSNYKCLILGYKQWQIYGYYGLS